MKDRHNRKYISPCQRFCIIVYILCVILEISTAPASAENTRENIMSETVGRAFMLCIYLPEGYSTSGMRYPVVYLLDADKHFKQVARKVDIKIRQGHIRPIIIAGIGYNAGRNFRKQDYTPTRISGFTGSGGVEKFYGFIRNELIPLIDARYRTIPEQKGRAIAGHSLGALAVYQGLYCHRDLFGIYIAVSPALWWDRELFFRTTPAWRTQIQGEPLKVFTAAGSVEHPATVNYARRITRVLAKKNKIGISASFILISGMDHEKAAVPAIIRSIEKGFTTRSGE